MKCISTLSPLSCPVVYLNEQIETIDVSEALRRVSSQRAAHALHYRQKHDQQLSLAVYLLLQEALRTEYGIQESPEFTFEQYGKPQLKHHPHIHFNLSHCHHAALCAVSEQPVGCDIEAVPEHLDMEVCRQCFNEQEIADILASEHPAIQFTVLWTKKEAFLKLTGKGLTDDLPSLFLSPETEHITFQTHAAADNAYVYTVCQHVKRQKL